MKKKVDNIYYKNLSFNNLLNCYKIIKKTCKNKKAINKFELNLNTNIYNIYTSLYNKTYIPYKYTIFMIFEPKPRIVMSQCITDKIVNHFVSKYYLLPYLESNLIDSNVATRVNKGTSYAKKLMVKYINNLRMIDKYKDIYVLKIDISKYFYNIDHDILKNILNRKIKDKDVLDVLYKIIDSTNSTYINDCIKKLKNDRIKYLDNLELIKETEEIPLYEYDKGCSIGNQTSQAFGLIYLCGFNHYLKENLHLKYVVNYMDDFIIIHEDKNYLKYCLEKIEK